MNTTKQQAAPATDRYDTVVIGGGIAGVSVAYELARDQRVALLDMEPALAYHTTGRSAATFSESYGGEAVRMLSTASRTFFEDPPSGFARPLLVPRPRLWIAGTGRADALRQHASDVSRLVPSITLLDPGEASELCPVLRPEAVSMAMLEPNATDIDVHALHQGYVTGLRARGGDVRTSTAVVELDRLDADWHVTSRDGWTCRSETVVNAAGAWADRVGGLAGVRPLGLEPLRRTIFMAPAGDRRDIDELPLIIDVDGRFYVKPESGQFLCSPSEESPSEPIDARPDELEIARAIERINEATSLDIKRVTSSWAGLRTFAADRTPVAGFDDEVAGFYWFAGQGGYGIQTAPALARAAASTIRGAPWPVDLSELGLDPSRLDRHRLDDLLDERSDKSDQGRHPYDSRTEGAT